MMHVVSELENGDVLLKNRSLRVAMDDMLLGTLLSLPHSHSDQLVMDSGNAAPSVVRQAEEYLEAGAFPFSGHRCQQRKRRKLLTRLI